MAVLGQSILSRLSSVPDDSLSAMPFTLGQAATSSSLSNATYGTLAQGLGAVAGWIAQQNTFAGVPGLLSKARLRVLDIGDVTMRQDAMRVINQLQALPGDQQQIFLGMLRSGQITLPLGDESIDTAAALRVAFPGTRFLVDSGQSVSQIFRDVLDGAEQASLDLEHRFIRNPGETVLETALAPATALLYASGAIPADTPLGDVTQKLYDEFKVSPVDATISVAFSPFNATVRGLGWVGNTAEEHKQVPGISLVTKTFPAIKSAADNILTVVNAGVEWFDDNVSSVAAEALGFQPGTKAYDEATHAFTALAQIMVAEVGGEFFRSAKTISSQFAETAVPTLAAENAATAEAGLIGTVLHPVESFINPAIRDFAARYGAKPVADWVTGSEANRLYDRIDALKAGGPAGSAESRILQQYAGLMSREVASRLADTERAFYPQVFVEGVDLAAKLEKATDAVKDQMARIVTDQTLDGPSRMEAFANLKIEEDSIAKNVSRTFEPMFDIPRQPKIQAFARDPLASNIKWLQAPKRLTQGVIRDFTNNLPRFPKLINPARTTGSLVSETVAGGGSRYVNWVEQNITTMGRYLGIAKVPREVVTDLIQQMLDVKTDQDFYDLAASIRDTINRYLPSNTPDLLRRRLTTFWNRTIDDDLRALVPKDYVDENGNVHTFSVPILRDRVTGRIIPSRPTEEVNNIRLPDPRLLRSAHNSTLRVVSRLQERGTRGSNLLLLPRAVMDLSTATLKGATLLFRIPAIILRKELEGVAGNLAAGVRSAFTSEKELPGVLTSSADSQLGNLYRTAFEMGGRERQVVTIQTSSYLGGGAIPDRYTWGGWYDMLAQDHSDLLTRTFAQIGLDEARMKAILEGTDESVPLLTEWWKKSGEQHLDRTGETIDQFVASHKELILDHTSRGDPRLINVVASGRTGTPNAAGLTEAEELARLPGAGQTLDPVTGRTYDDLRTSLRDNNRSLQDMMRTELDPDRRAALIDQFQSNMEELRRIADEVGDFSQSTDVPLSREQALRNELEHRWQSREVSMPHVIKVRKYVQDSIDSGGGIVEAMNSWSRQFNDMWYNNRVFGWLSSAELKLTRGSLYRQKALEYYNTLRDGGMGATEAGAFASVRAAAFTRDLHYDLATRSTVQQSLRNVFWFAPATQEMLYRWLYQIPSQYYEVPGLALLGFKAEAWISLLKATGLIQKDPTTGEDVVTVPGLNSLVETLSGGHLKINDINDIKIKNFNLVTEGFGPSLSPLAGLIIGTAAQDFGGVFKNISQVLQPYGTEVGYLPSPVVYGMETLGINPASLGFLSHGYYQQAWDSARDQAVQYAYVDVVKNGDPPPALSDYSLDPKAADYADTPENEKAYTDAYAAWFKRFQQTTDEYVRGIAATKLVASMVSPGALTMTSTEKARFEKWYTETILPQFTPQGGYSPQQKEELLSYDATHPLSAAFGVSYGYYTGKPPTSGYSPVEQSNILNSYLDGVKQRLSPDEYQRLLPALLSRQVYLQHLEYQLRQISPTLDAAELLANNYQRTQALRGYQRTWDIYKALNPQAADTIARNETNITKAFGYERPTFETQLAIDTIHGLNELAPLFTGAGGLTDSEYKTVKSTLYQAIFGNVPDFQGRQSPLQADFQWWYTNVLDPYTNTVEPLYQQALVATEAGRTDLASRLYRQISLTNEEWSSKDLSHGGRPFPSPEEFFYNSQSPVQQDATRNNWATKPIAWLDTYQRQTLGYADFPDEQKFWDQINKAEDAFHTFVAREGVSPASTQFDNLRKAVDAYELQIANQTGPDAVRLLALNNAAPYIRLQETGFGSGNDTWKTLFGLADYINQTLVSRGESPKGYSQDALALKSYFYRALQTLEARDATFRDQLWSLSFAFPARGLTQRLGVPLFEAVFFGQFEPRFIPTGLDQVYTGQTGAPSGT